jgi:hypothetical protein
MIQKYRTEVIQYATNNNLYSNCNGISFVNTGTVDVLVNKYTITPGTSLTINGNAGEMDVTQYIMYFPNGNGNLTVIRKFYV